MGNLMSQNTRGGTITDHDRAVLALKAQRRKLEDQTRALEARADQAAAAAKQLLAAHKRERALLALQRKRLADNQARSIQAYLLNVEDMLASMELTKQQAGVTAALKQGNEALKLAQQQMPLDDIARLMDETAEAKAYQEQVADALTGQLDDADNEAVLKELATLEEAAAAEEAAELPAAPAVPAAAAGKEEEEEELPSVPATRVVADGQQRQQAQRQEERQLEEPLPAS